MARPAAKPKLKPYYCTMHVTRTEEWLVEAESEAHARTLLEDGGGHRIQIGECVHFEIDKLTD